MATLLLASQFLWSQSSVVVTEQNVYGDTKKVIIEEWRYPSTVSCVNSEGDIATFILADNSMQTKELRLDSVVINDMHIMIGAGGYQKDTLYFCGQNVKSKCAVVGFFNINDAFNNNADIYMEDINLCGYPEVNLQNLTRLVCYVGPDDTRHIVCIGKSKEEYPCVVDVTGFAMGSMGLAWGYNGGYIEDKRESFYDVKLIPVGEQITTGYYVVTSGMDNKWHKYLSLRAYRYDDIFSATGPQNTKHIFCIDTSFSRPWTQDDVLLTQLPDERFATISYRCAYMTGLDNPNSDAATFNTLNLSMFHLPTFVSGSVNSMVGNAVSGTQSIISNNLERFITRRGTNTVAFLQDIQYSMSPFMHGIFCEVDITGVSTVSATRPYSQTSASMQGLTLYNNVANYALGGFDNNDITNLEFEMETFNNNSSCANMTDLEFSNIRPLRSVNEEKDFLVSSFRIEFHKVTPERFVVPQTVKCEK